jgi:hypothetical protein
VIIGKLIPAGTGLLHYHEDEVADNLPMDMVMQSVGDMSDGTDGE